MFAWVGSQFDAVLSTYVLGVVTALMAGITPIALTAMTMWVTLYGWAVLRNEVSETVPTFLWKVFKIGLVLALALQSGFYISNVSDSANALATGVATTFLPAAVDPMSVTTPYVLLDNFNDEASKLVLDLLKDAGVMRLDTMATLIEMSRMGVPAWRLKIVFNMVEDGSDVASTFEHLLEFLQTRPIATACICARVGINEIYGRVKGLGDAADLIRMANDTTDYKSLIVNTVKLDEKLALAEALANRRLACGVVPELDACFAALNLSSVPT